MSEDQDDMFVLAGEYVLGTLDHADRLTVEARIAREPAMALAVAYWEQHLHPLTGLILPSNPPDSLWSRLALRTGIRGEVSKQPSVRLWQGLTAGAMILAASLAFIMVLPRPPVQASPDVRYIAALSPLDHPARFLAEARSDGNVIVTRASGTTETSGRSLQLWEVQEGVAKPASLGLLRSGQSVTIQSGTRPWDNVKLLITDEPAGGSPTGLPTGPVLFGGSLTRVSPLGQ